MERRVDRATMWALRETGREMKRAARRRAPIYDGDDPRAEPGRLKKSITTSRRLKRPAPHTYSLTVGPRGPVVHKYAQKIELIARFMAEAYNETVPRVREIHERAWKKAMKR